MAMDQRETIEQVKAEAERLTKKRALEAEEEAKRQEAADKQEATNQTKKV